MVPIIPSEPAGATDAVTELTPERMAEIKALLRYESSIAFYSARAKDSMLLLVAGIEQLREQLADQQRTTEYYADQSARRGEQLKAKGGQR